jgi:hypothetical protein
MLQVLWERGWIDSSKVVIARSMRYSKDGKKEDFGEDGKLKEGVYNTRFLTFCSNVRTSKMKSPTWNTLQLSYPDATRQYQSCLPPSIIANWLVKGSNTAGAQPNECIKNCHSISKSLGSESFRKSVAVCLSKVNIEMCR